MNHLFETVVQFKKMLSNLDGWLAKAAAHAKAKSFDVNVLVQARLAPDQFPLVKQVQSACDTAKFSAARLSGKEAPKHPDTETTIEELHKRIAAVVEYLGTYTAKDFEGAESRAIALPFLEGKSLKAGDYAMELQTPNFYFHVAHAYAILRHNGVDLGKMDYIGKLNLQ